MLRNIALAAIALASVAAITPASAHGSHFGGGGGFHRDGGFHDGGHFFHGGRFFHDGFYGYGYNGGDSCYRFVETEFGPRRIYTCN
jgi:hypothetical protein